MSARFRLVQYLPDPFTGTRVTIGTLLDSGSGSAELVRAPHLPGPACLGSHAAWTVLQLILDELSNASFDAESGDLSQLAVISTPQDVPKSVHDPAAWLRRTYLPQSSQVPQDSAARPHRPTRAALGARFLRQYGVAQYVQTKFRAEEHLGEVATAVKHPISQWVSGQELLLLLEPVIGTRPSLEDDLRQINETFLAYHQLFQFRQLHRRIEYLVYVLPFGYGGAVKDTRHVLSTNTVQVLDGDDPGERQRLISTIREVGQSGVEQGILRRSRASTQFILRFEGAVSRTR